MYKFYFYEFIMKVRIQIYVIYILNHINIMKITLVFFTFSGIYTSQAQNPLKIDDPGIVEKTMVVINKPGKTDSLDLKENPAFRLYPNPAKNKVEIEIRGFAPGYILVQLIDKNGKLARNDKRLVFSGNEIIVFMFSEKPGLYIVLLKQGEYVIRSKLVIL